MSEIKETGAEVSGAKVFGSLTINKRVLETPSRTIAIDNISAITVGTVERKPNIALLIAAAVFFLAAVANGFTTYGGYGRSQALNPVAVGSLILALILVMVYFFSGDTTHYLIISTNDGTRSLFTGPRVSMLEEVRQLLTLKINARDESATYTINFNNSKIEALNAGHVTAETVVQGNNNQFAVHSPHARVGSAGSDINLQNSPGSQIGWGHTARDIHATVSHIDYGSLMPHVTHMRDFYAKHPDQIALHQKIDEVLTLMRQGTPDAPSRGRIRTLAGDISNVLQAYPSAAQIFRDIIGLASG